MPEFCQPIPHSLAFDCIRARIRELKEAGEKVPKALCAASLLADRLTKKDGEAVKRQADYARIWGYSESWVSRNIEEIRAEAEAQRTFYKAEREAESQKRAKNPMQDECKTDASPAQDEFKPDPPTEAENGTLERCTQEECKADASASQGESKTYNNTSSDCKNNTSPSASAPAREEAPPDSSSPPEPEPPPEGSNRFAFLAERDEPHRAAIEHAAGKSPRDPADPYWLAKLSRSEWGRRNALTKHDIKPLLNDYSGEVVLAGIVIAGDDNNPNKSFLNSILKRLHEQEQRAQQGYSPDTSSGNRDPSRRTESRGRSGGRSARKRNRGGWHGQAYA